MRLRQLEYFLTVAAEGSFSRAAVALHMTQPPLSQSVLQLEKELGVQLLIRHPKGVTLTEAGTFLVAQGRQLLRWSRHLEEQTRNMGLGLAGRLHVAAVPSFSWNYLPPLLKAFDAAAPGVEVKLSDPEPAEVVRQVADGSVDIGFVATADASLLALANAGIIVDLLLDMPLMVALPPRLAHLPEPVDLALLAEEPWILPSRIPDFPGLIETVEQVWHEIRIRPSLVRYVSTLQAAVPLISADMGVGLLPQSFDVLARSGIRVLSPAQPVPPLQAAMVRSSHIPPSPVLTSFLNVARQTYTDEL